MDDIIEEVRGASTIYELIYYSEPLAFYFGMKPKEYWDSTYREIDMFCKANLIKQTEDFKKEILLEEAGTDKLIRADSMSKNPKILPITKKFSQLFKEKEKKPQTLEEQIRILRDMKGG